MNDINDRLTDLRNAIMKTKFLKIKMQIKLKIILKKILESDKQQEGKGITMLTPKQMLQGLSRAFAQVKAGNTSENL